MHFTVYLTAFILVVTTSVQLCAAQLRSSTQKVSVADVTKQYLAHVHSILTKPEPPSIKSQANAVEVIGTNLLFMVGVDGDMKFVVQVLNRIEDIKLKTIDDYVRITSKRMVSLFFANFLPAIRRAVRPFLVERDIREIISQLTSNFKPHYIAVHDTWAQIKAIGEPFLKTLSKRLTDLNRRAIAARESGQTDLSCFEAELKALEDENLKKGGEVIKGQIQTLHTIINEYLDNVTKISLDISRRCHTQ